MKARFRLRNVSRKSIPSQKCASTYAARSGTVRNVGGTDGKGNPATADESAGAILSTETACASSTLPPAKSSAEKTSDTQNRR
jgi:hypothetical protein